MTKELKSNTIKKKVWNTKSKSKLNGDNNPNFKHGQNLKGKISYEYHNWQNLKMKNVLCNEWNQSFELFFKDTGKRPVEGYILVRKNTKNPHNISNSYWGHPKLRYFRDFEGKKFGQWLVLQKDFERKGHHWLCQCSCGRRDHITQKNLIDGISTKCKSCASPKPYKNHCHKDALYRLFHSIKARCHTKSNKNYLHYGGRGIKICDRWLESVKNFIDDMGPRPSNEHSIDRIDNDGDYCPENCRWVDQKTQVANRRKMSDLQEEIKILKEKLSKYEANS